jgi:hypothetical protein
MITTTIHIERPENTVLATGIGAQIEIDDASPRRDAGEDRDFLTFLLFLSPSPSVGLLPRDVVQDERNSDPLTGALARYRVLAVASFEADHIEAVIQQIVGL